MKRNYKSKDKFPNESSEASHNEYFRSAMRLQFFNNKYVIDNKTNCWNWTGASNGFYGQIRTGSKMEGAHRYSYRKFVGYIPPSYQIDHLCRNTFCVNPSHLEAVLQNENNKRSNSASAIHARKTSCKYGHPFDDANTRKTKRGRVCRQCARNYASNKRNISMENRSWL